jgi:hypothetical protein
MKNISLSQEDYDFLKDLSHELKTQTNDGNAQPVYWGIMESQFRATPDDWGSETRINIEGEEYTLEQAVDHITGSIETGLESEAWKDVDKEDSYEVVRFAEEWFGWHCGTYDVIEEEVLTRDTGAFLTKRAAKEYVERFGYNHKKPRTYALTAYRNFELEHLLNILKKINFSEQ